MECRNRYSLANVTGLPLTQQPPRTDPGVRDYPTGLFRNTRFPQQPKPLDLPRFSTSSHPDALDACYVTSW